MNYLKRLENTIRYRKQRKKGTTICNNANVDDFSFFEGNNYVGNNSIIRKTKIGYSSYVGNNCELINAIVGKYSSIARGFHVVIGQHPTCGFVSTSPMFYSDKHVLRKKYVSKTLFDEFREIEKGVSIKIGNDVWIGENVSVMEGVEIGDGAIIGANSLVTKSLEPYGVYVGIPAKRIRFRFKEDDIAKLIKFKWWDKGEDWIQENVDSFANIDVFMSKIKDDE